jgi:signal transduction protein with GAF and PtsI domain
VNPSEATPAARRPVDVFATVAAAMVTEDDVIDTLTQLIVGCAGALDAGGAGLVVIRPDTDDLELLAATSHATESLELFQLQTDTGPCVDTVRAGAPVVVPDLDGIEQRWPALLEVFRAAGFASLHATPLRWQGDVLGALNVFWSDERDTRELAALLQGFADVATIAIVHAGRVSHAQVLERTRAALAGRHVVEQAKGVLAYQETLDMEAAYHRLLALAATSGHPLSATAQQVVSEAATGRRTVPPRSG